MSEAAVASAETAAPVEGAGSVQTSEQSSVQTSEQEVVEAAEEAKGGPLTEDELATLQSLLGRHKFKQKVDGKEYEVDFEEMRKGFSHGQAANARMQEAAELQKQFKPFADAADALKSGDWRPMVEMVGYENAKKFSEDLLIHEIEWNKMSPQEQAYKQAELERDQLRAEKEARLKKDAEDQKTAAEKDAWDEIDNDVAEAIKQSGRKPTPRLIARIATEMLDHLEFRKSKLPAADALGKADSRFWTDFAEISAGMDPKDIAAKLPPEVRDALRKLEVETASSHGFNAGRRPPSPKASKRRGPSKRMSTDNFFENMEKRFG